ncbi:hypothetical protein BJ138DRAFT_1180781 [Hygrophoropsis aurantiaca]|uniref:Uncharacterized protein n=1 Tax=Hygrophoropsis aurantiaca TaxID=72124 RepID=A0ACB8A9M7_9AGAM|nr:hypothetical protein BJ138DRAFT_1180781 [Hygrophoropsis aurantiaca]
MLSVTSRISRVALVLYPNPRMLAWRLFRSAMDVVSRARQSSGDCGFAAAIFVPKLYCKNSLPEKLVKAGKELWVKLFPFEYYSGKPSRFLKADIQNFKEQYEGIQERDTLKDIINHRRVLTFEINAHASACYAWQERVEAVIRTEQDQIRTKRREEIEDRLTALGWGHELKMVESGRYRHEFHGLPFFAKAAPIDTKEWKKIKHVLVKFIENHRTRRHLHILKEDYRSRFSSLSSICFQVSRDMIKVHGVKQVIPNTLDILFIPQVRELLEVDFDTDFNLKDVEAKLFSILPSLLVHWYDDMMAQFQACVSRKKNDSGVDPFERAAQIFKCKQCLKALHRSDVIGHHCATDPMRMYSSDNVCLSKEKPNNAMEIDRGAVYTTVATDVFRQRPWTWEYLDVDPWRERIANLFEALGEDVTMATKKTMARCGLWVSCNYCRSPKGMQWQAALEHCIQSHLNVEDSDLTWTLLDSELKPEDGNKKKMR